MVSAIKDLAIEIGQTPNREQFQEKCGYSRHQITVVFGSYTTLLQAAGLEPRNQKRITNEVFRRDLEAHLEKYEPRAPEQVEKYKRVLFIPDTHFPFSHQGTLEKIYRFAEREKPEIVVQLGDLYDAYSHAKFPKSVNIFTPREEHRAARLMAETMWKEIKAVVPSARCIQTAGNHDIRALKRILEAYPALEDWAEKMFLEAMSFDGVETITDTREELRLPGDVIVMHGFKSKIGDHRDYTMYNSVCGHLHTGGVLFRQIRGRVLWELNAGLAGDPESKGLSYMPSKITNWTLGWGWLDEYGPRFIHA
jgi:predicted phosphodiesterase